MGTPHNDTSWTGWAISSFTNKMAAASGEMQAKPSRQADGRASSVPPRADTSRPSQSSASTLYRKALAGSAAPLRTRTSPEQLFPNGQGEDDEIDEAWGDMSEDAFFDATSEIGGTNTTTTNKTKIPSTSTTFDDGGEPDFEEWLKAQAQAKSKTQLPKGLSKTSSTTIKKGRPSELSTQSAPAIPTRGQTKQSAAAAAVAKKAAVDKKAAVPPKPFSIQPKDGVGEDDWGDAWD
jgi:SCY1-like protein 1